MSFVKLTYSILFIFVFLLTSSCKKDEKIKTINISNHPCLKILDNGLYYEYNLDGRIKCTYYINNDNKVVDKVYSYSGDTIIETYIVPDIESGSLVIDKSVVGKNGFINMKYSFVHNFYSDHTMIYRYTYDEYNHLIFYTYGDKGYGSKYVYENDNLVEVWGITSTDTTLNSKLVYDLNIENKEAAWTEWAERTGKCSKNLLLKVNFMNDSPNNYIEYTYVLSNGYPIQKHTHTKNSNYDIDEYLFTDWQCLK